MKVKVKKIIHDVLFSLSFLALAAFIIFCSMIKDIYKPKFLIDPEVTTIIESK